MNIIEWSLNVLLVPLLSSTYSSLIVVRYIEFSQLRARAEEVVSKTRTLLFAVFVEGVEGFEKSHPAVPGQINPRFQFGELEIVSNKFRERGHVRAAEETAQMLGILLKRWRAAFERGKLSEGEWEEEGLTQLINRDVFDLKPSLTALFTIRHWNIGG
jgi:hypothetical protein